MENRFMAIVTHERPHFDEIAAIWLLRNFGEAHFPGIGTAKIEYWSAGGKTPDGRPADEYEKEGILLIGVGGGRFDEHPTTSKARKEGECAATLVAKALRVAEDSALEKILKFVVNGDRKGSGHPFDLACVVKSLHNQYPDNPEKVMEWAMTGLEAKYREQHQFFTATKEEFERVARREEVTIANGEALLTMDMVVVESDNEQIGKFARSRYGGNAAIIVQKRSSGNVQIYTNKECDLDLKEVARVIRLAEQEAKGATVAADFKALEAEGKVPGAEEWFFHLAGQMLLNGSLTASDVPPTKLSLDHITGLIRRYIRVRTRAPVRRW